MKNCPIPHLETRTSRVLPFGNHGCGAAAVPWFLACLSSSDLNRVAGGKEVKADAQSYICLSVSSEINAQPASWKDSEWEDGFAVTPTPSALSKIGPCAHLRRWKFAGLLGRVKSLACPTLRRRDTSKRGHHNGLAQRSRERGESFRRKFAQSSRICVVFTAFRPWVNFRFRRLSTTKMPCSGNTTSYRTWLNVGFARPAAFQVHGQSVTVPSWKVRRTAVELNNGGFKYICWNWEPALLPGMLAAWVSKTWETTSCPWNSPLFCLREGCFSFRYNNCCIFLHPEASIVDRRIW